MTRKSVLSPDEEWSWAVGRGSLLMQAWPSENSADYRDRDGIYRGQKGIVQISQWQIAPRNVHRTQMTIVTDGVACVRTWNRIHPDLTLSRLAWQMLEELA